MIKVMEETPETFVGSQQLEAKQEEIFKEVAEKEII